MHSITLCAAVIVLMACYVTAHDSQKSQQNGEDFWCYVCETNVGSGSKSKSKSKHSDPCHPNNLQKKSAKSRATVATDCDYCLTRTTHYPVDGEDVFHYKRECAQYSPEKTCDESQLDGDFDSFIDNGDHTITTTCCEFNNCNDNASAGLQATISTVVGLFTLLRLF